MTVQESSFVGPVAIEEEGVLDENLREKSPNDEPLLKELMNANGEKFHLYGNHHKNKNDDNETESNIVVRKRGRRRADGLIIII